MRFLLSSLVAASVLVLAQAGETEANKCSPETVTVEKEGKCYPSTVTVKDIQYKTTTDIQYKITTETQYKTTTDIQYKTTTETKVDYQTVTVTYTDTTTIKDTSTITNVPDCPRCPSAGTVTITNVDTVTATQVPDCPSAGTITITNVATITTVVPSVIESVETTVDTVTSTVEVTVTEAGPTTTITDCPAPPPPPPEPLDGLVLCSSRIVNPTYTPAEPLPTTYHWGCPPDTICTPPQVDCNFERGPPEEGYFCHPDECKPTPPIPDYVNVTGSSPTDTDCAWYKPPPGFFNLNPEDFGLTYAIFDIFGQPVCKGPSEHWGDSTWNDWHADKPPHMRIVRGTNNPLARLLQRQSVSATPAGCYGVFNKANIAGQAVAYAFEKLCPDTTAFRKAIVDCQDCVDDAASPAGPNTFPKLQIYLNWCADPAHAPAPV